MARRIRSIKPELLEDEKVAGLSDTAFRVFIGCITMSDDRGTFRAHPKQVEKEVYWLAIPEKSVPEALNELETSGMVTLYRARGQQYGQFVNWGKHQRIDNASKEGLLPGPDQADDATRRDTPRVSASSQGPPRAPEGPPRFAAGSGSGSGSGGDLDLERAPMPEPPTSGVFRSDRPPAVESEYDLGRRVFCELWERKYKQQWFDPGAKIGPDSSDEAFKRIGHWSRSTGAERSEEHCRHYWSSFLRDHGRASILDERRHPPAWAKDPNQYGYPPKARKAMPPPAPEPTGTLLTPQEMAKRAAELATKRTA